MTLIERRTDVVKEKQALDRDKGYDAPHVPGIVRAPIPVSIMVHVPRSVFAHCRDTGVSTEKWARITLDRWLGRHATDRALVPHRRESSFELVNLRVPRRGWHWLYRMITTCDSSSSV